MKSVLTVDWSRGAHETISDAAEQCGLSHLSAFGIHEAKDLISKNWPIGMIFLDICSGSSAGLAFLKALRKSVLLNDVELSDISAAAFSHYGSVTGFSQGIRTLPVVALVDEVDSNDIYDAQQLGIASVLRKPLTKQVVVTQLEKLVFTKDKLLSGVW